MSGAVITSAGVVGTALAAGPATSAARPAPAPVATPASVVTTAPVKPRRTAPAPKRVSRSTHRSALVGWPRTIAHAMLLRRGWSEGEWSCLDALWTRESNWNVTASNGNSGAYGIPQALPADKMSTMGSDWRTNPVTQIRWGLSYIARSYGDPCSALDHSNSYGYY